MSALALDSIPTLWRASELGRSAPTVVGSGFAALDAELPGGGWPAGQLTEVLQPEAGWREWRLLGPALAGLARRGSVFLVGPPMAPCLPALAAQGLRPESLCWVRAQSAAQRQWAAEQGLRCRDLSAMLVWLPSTSSQALRRLHLAAQSGHQAEPPLLWVLRPWPAQQQASPAVLRLGLRGGADDGLELHLFKRRGPGLTHPIWLDAPRPAALRPRPESPAAASGMPLRPLGPDLRRHHVVDRTAAGHGA